MKSLQIILVCFFIFFLNHSFSQTDSLYFDVKIVESTTFKSLKGAYVKVFSEDNRPIATFETDSTGGVRFSLKFGDLYKIVASGENKVERYFLVDLKMINDEYGVEPFQFSGECQVSLFDEKPDVDYGYILNNPITRFYPVEQSIFLAFDMKMAEKMIKEVEKVMSQDTQK